MWLQTRQLAGDKSACGGRSGCCQGWAQALSLTLVKQPIESGLNQANMNKAVWLQTRKLAGDNERLRGEIRVLRGEQQALASELHAWQARWQTSVLANRNLMEQLAMGPGPGPGMVRTPNKQQSQEPFP